MRTTTSAIRESGSTRYHIAAPPLRAARPGTLPARTHWEERRPRSLVLLAAAFVVATYLEKLALSDSYLVQNPYKASGLLLAVVFAIARLPTARFWAGPVKFFCLFFALSAIPELGRLFTDRSGDSASSLRGYAQYAQSFLVYLIFYDLARDRKAAKVVILTYVGSTILLSLIANLNVGGLVGGSTVSADGIVERVGVLGMNLNYQAVLYAVAITGITCLGLARWPRLGVWDWVLVGGAASMLLAQLRTGSRGALLVLAVGLAAALALMFRGRLWAAYVLLVPLVLFGIGSAVMRSEVLLARIDDTVYKRDWGARDVLAAEAWEMIKERPITGWGGISNDELGARMGTPLFAAHNTYLQIASSFGLLGFVAWALVIGSTGWRLWQHRKDFWARALLAGLSAHMVAMVTGNYGYIAIPWILLALAGAMPFNVFNPLRPGQRPR